MKYTTAEIWLYNGIAGIILGIIIVYIINKIAEKF